MGTFGGKRTTSIHPGYGNNLMGRHVAPLEQRNLTDLAAETAPSPSWINDDNHIRDWVNANSMRTIERISTINKLRAIKVLMSGWISDRDVDAIKVFISSVSTRAEAASFRAGIKLNTFSSLGQRFRCHGRHDSHAQVDTDHELPSAKLDARIRRCFRRCFRQ